ncbi:MAG: exodeoxyribonuclease alpha subunit [Clostridia bacterium]|jgi:exodeoxyribonuclease V alpha subunit|nr:exodeoxyribonuclease alpha subunit [Clostridia bacterium]
MECLSGIVERITFQNEENGFSVIKIRSKGYSDLVTVVGNITGINVGSVVNLKGQWRFDSKYGKQFAVKEYTETIPATVAGIEKYLGSGLIKGIGPVNARRIVKKFKEDTIRIIEEEPDRLVEAEGIGLKRVEMIKKAWQEQKEIKNVMLFLQSQGVSTSFAVKIYKTYGNDSIKLVRENPYRLADDIWGIGFKTADQIARKMGYDPNSYERCRAGIIYILNQLANDGHCFATRQQLEKLGIEILEIEKEKVEDTLKKMLQEKSIIFEGEDAFYLPPFFYSELGVAEKIKELISKESKFKSFGVEEIIEQVQRENGIIYDEIQLQAIRAAVSSKFMVLTGGPGTGKTTTTLAIIKIFEKMQARVLLAAPTGRAAKRLAEATGMEAKTIHRLLEFKPADGYLRNSDNPLECDVLIIDETSMVDIILMYNLLKAVPRDAVVILVGDVDQLPSVGPGNVLRDIIASGIVNVVKLTRIFRQAQGSMIITNAHKINKGIFPVVKSDRKSDFFFIAENDPQKIVEQIKSLCSQRLSKYYKVDPIADIQVITPMQRGEVGARNLNEVLQETLNPTSVYTYSGGTKFKLNDKVMQVKNNYDKNVFNGDIGRITHIDLEDKQVRIMFDDLEVEYDVTELDEVVLAYATTVHKSQGSEFKIVVAPLVTQHYMMLQRNLLYTCITRAKKIFILIGSKKALAMAIKNNKVTQRNTMLAERLKEADILKG